MAGMKYIVITAKHVDGVTMYPSKASPHNIIDATSYKKDPILALRKACDKHGIKLGYYYCQTWDWMHPHALAAHSGTVFRDNYWDWPDRSKKDTDIFYREKVYPQVDELMKQYAPDLIWFDVPGLIKKEQSFNLLKIVRSHDPECIINNRIGNNMGDYGTPEQYIPGGSDDFFEVCMTIRDHWGYSHFDRNFKSSKTIIQNLVDIAHKGGNYLLNVGPTGEGIFPEPSVRTLQGVGQWMEKHGESVYGTSGSPLGRLPFDGRCTAKPGKLFIHLFDWPASRELVVPGIRSPVEQIYFLADRDKKALEFSQVSSDVKIALSAASIPASILDENSTVLVIEYEGDLRTDQRPVLIDPAYTATLTPHEATIDGDRLKYEFVHQWGPYRGYHVQDWVETDDSMNWEIRAIRDGRYDVEFTYSAAPGCEENEFVFSAGDDHLMAGVQNTGSWQTYKTYLIGSIALKKSESITLSVKPEKLGDHSLMDLKSVRLIPIPAKRPGS
jgi:alpha-L-fucosidase